MTSDIVWVSDELANLKDEIVEVEHNEYAGGPRYLVTFKNNYQASIIRNMYSYGVELGVMYKDVGLVYDTPVTDDVIGYLTPDKLAHHLAEIAALPERA